MDFVGVKEMLEAINASDISYFEYKTCDGHIIMDKSLTRNSKEAVSSVKENTASSINKTTDNEDLKKQTEIIENTTGNDKEKSKIQDDQNLYIVKSPMVGTFYSASGEGKAPFVEKDKEIKKGDILCIIEAMKLMNEIESEVNGKVVEILVKDGDMVEYDQPLFKVKESK